MDIVSKIVNMLGEGVGWIQAIGFAFDAVAFAWAFVVLLSNGSEGRQKAKPWFIGATVGLIGLLLAPEIPKFLRSKLGF